MNKFNRHTVSKVRKHFLNNPNDTLEDISNKFNLTKSTVGSYLTNKDNLNIVPSLNESNLYFLFSNIMERKIVTETNGRTITNSYDFNFEDKTFMSSFGFIV